MKFGSRRQASALAATMLVLLALLSFSPANDSLAADAPARRKVIIDQDAFGPAGSNLQAILMLLQAKDVEVLGITIPSGDGWRDEEVSHTLRLLEIAHRTEVPVYPGAVFPLVNTQLRTKRWEELYGQLFYKGAWTEVWPKEGAVRRTPYHADPYLVPPSSAGQPTIKAVQENAASFLSRTVHEFPGQVTILAAGPLTNLAIAARMDPQFSSLARELVFMGGSFNPTAADNAFAAEYVNVPRREFNMRFDPEAASIVLHEPWKKITEVPIGQRSGAVRRLSRPVRPVVSDVGRTRGRGVARPHDRNPRQESSRGCRYQLHRRLRQYAELGCRRGSRAGRTAGDGSFRRRRSAVRASGHWSAEGTHAGTLTLNAHSP